MLKSENMSVNDLKGLLLKMGADPAQVDKLAGLGEHSGKKVSLKELMTLLNREAENIYDNNAIHSSAKDGNSAGAKGNNDQSGRGEGTISSIAGGEKVVGEKTQVDFEQLMSKADLRKTAPRQVVEQIVKGVKIQVEGGQTKARISLHPPSLGKVNMHIVTRDNQVSATFFAETSLVKEIIESNLPQLRESFQQQGLKVDQFNVFVGHQPAGNQAGQQNFSNAGGAHRSAGEGLEEEEGIIALEQMKRRAMGSHSVDLFI
jgi:flagellar hook-length control protein FliK